MKIEARTQRGSGVLLCVVGDGGPGGFVTAFTTKVALEADGPMAADYGHRGLPESLDSRRRLCRVLGLSFDGFTAAEQVHSASVAVVEQPQAGSGRENPGDLLPGADAMVTALAGVTLAVYTADCVPILLADPVSGAVAAAHAGWRGTLAGVVENTVAAMCDQFGARHENISAYLGPAIGECCYDVKEDFFSRLAGRDLEYLIERGSRRFFDLVAWNRARLCSAGLRPAAVFSADICTRCHPELFFSYRGDPERRGSNISLISRLDPRGT